MPFYSNADGGLMAVNFDVVETINGAEGVCGGALIPSLGAAVPTRAGFARRALRRVAYAE
jgi:hypothetical protein